MSSKRADTEEEALRKRDATQWRERADDLARAAARLLKDYDAAVRSGKTLKAGVHFPLREALAAYTLREALAAYLRTN